MVDQWDLYNGRRIGSRPQTVDGYFTIEQSP